MKRAVLIEGALLLAISFVCIAEAIRLIAETDPKAVVDRLGPGFYVLILGVALLSIGIAHLLVHYREEPDVKKFSISREMKMRIIMMTMALVVYTLLIDLIGYLASSVVFFLLEFRIAGVKSWATSLTLAFVVTGGYYLVFVKWCNMIFPRGILF